MRTNSIGRAFTITAWIAISAFMSSTVEATDYTWDAGGDGANWSDPLNWSDDVLPDGDDDLLIAGGVDVQLTNGTTVASVTISNATLTFAGWDTALTSGAVSVRGSSGKITHLSNSDTNAADGWQSEHRVYLHCDSLFIEANAAIDADEKGYAGGVSASKNGLGPGGGLGNSAFGSGGHGGAGAIVSGSYGQTYGVVSAPVEPGSGGGYYSQGSGDGGGVILIEATGLVTVNGTIKANGGSAPSNINNACGASGGSIFITCGTFGGTNGLLSACGGLSGRYAGSSGGGGRIAVVYTNTVAQGQAPVPSVQFTAAAGSLGANNSSGLYGDIGTLYFPDACFLTETMSHSGEWTVPGLTNWASDTLTISNAWFKFAASDFALTVTNAITVLGGVSPLNRLDLTPSTVSCGDLVVTNIAGVTDGAYLHLLSSSNAVAAADGCGPLIEVARTLSVSSNSVIYPYSNPTNGCGVAFAVQDLVIAEGGEINADGLGYRGGTNKTDHGQGTGGTLSVGAAAGAGGAGYGGVGGNGYTTSVGGVSYGSSNAPVHSGSGSGASNKGTVAGKPGGGLIRLTVSDHASLDGNISANGIDATGETYGGGGAGGGIYLHCRTLDGAGALSAAGGASGTSGSSSGGGGGRIAVWRAWDTSSLSSTNVAGGSSNNEDGQSGTIVWITTSATITNLFATNETATTAELVANLTATGMAPTTVFCYWGTNDGGSVTSAWETNDVLGVRAPGVLTNAIDDLTPGTLYAFRFLASNAFAQTWAEPTAFFSTPGGGIVLNNDGGATNETCTSATLRGEIVIGNPIPDTYICWGDNDPGSDATNDWDHIIDLGSRFGPFSAPVTGLLANETYFYRGYATNETDDAWAATATNFTTTSPTISISDAVVAEGAGGTTTALLFVVTLSDTSSVPVTVTVTTSNGTATAGADYVATNGTFTVPAGTVSKVLTVTVNGDNLDEFPSETLTVSLTAPAFATLADGDGLGTIVDDDDVADSAVWTGTGNWQSLTNWSHGAVPSPSDSVTIPSGTSCTLSNSTVVASLTVSNATLTFAGWDTALTSGAVRVSGASGVITHLSNTDTNAADGWQSEHRVYLHCDSLFVEANAMIDAAEKGYAGGVSASKSGRGPGGGLADSLSGSGGHGGAGATVSGTYGQTYGTSAAPVEPGSGGAYYGGSVGGDGGGVVLIEATGQVTVNGTVRADGGAGVNNNGNGASGGSIFITCGTFGGTNGILNAQGGSGARYSGSSGGGGRIAVVYTNTVAQGQASVPSVQFTTAAGAFGANNTSGLLGDIGTLYFPDARFLTETMSHSGEWTVPGLTSWSSDHLTISNAWFRFAASDFVLTVTNAITVLGGVLPLNRLDLTPSTLSCGDLVLTNIGGVTDGAYLHLLSSPNAVAEADGCGPRIEVAGTLNVSSNSAVYPHSNATNGCGIGFTVQDLVIAEGGEINADGLGYRGGTNSADHGQGTGGTLSGVTFAGGAGYGGKGGDGNGGVGGVTYGSSNAPAHSGSGSGYSTASGGLTGLAGGGLVRLDVTKSVVLDGIITAAGTGTSGNYGGGGAGGGIYISCSSFAGGGQLVAEGGTAGKFGGGGGGGGRIAVWRTSDTSALSSTNVAGGSGASEDGDPGTIYWQTLSPASTLFRFR